MSRDFSKDGKKCGHEGNTDRVFVVRGQDATIEQCERHCLDDSNCVAYSAVFGIWCIGCDRPLDINHGGFLGYLKYRNSIKIQLEPLFT